MTLNNFDMCLILTFQRNVWWAILIKYLYIIRTQRPFHFSHGNFDAILKMLAHLSASIFTSKSNHYSLIGHGILLYNFHKYCMICHLSMFEKLKNIMRDTVCRRFLHHNVKSYYIWENVCRTFMRHIVVNYYILAIDVNASCKAKCSNYYILQRHYILGCDSRSWSAYGMG